MKARNHERDAATGRKTLLVAVKSAVLYRVIEHLFDEQRDFRVVAAPRGGSLEQHAGRILPELVIAHAGLLGREACATVAALKRLSPQTQVILLCSMKGLARVSRKCCASYLDEEAVVRSLPAAARRLAAKRQSRQPGA